MTDKAVAPRRVVAIHYTLKDAGGALLDSSAGGPPLPYLHGAGNVVPGLERQLDGRSVGDRFDVVVAPADGYGEQQPGSAAAVPRSAFPADVELAAGMQFTTRDEQGHDVQLWITAVDGDQVSVDTQHPLAGVELHFAVEVVSVREATAEELERGYPGATGTGGH